MNGRGTKREKGSETGKRRRKRRRRGGVGGGERREERGGGVASECERGRRASEQGHKEEMGRKIWPRGPEQGAIGAAVTACLYAGSGRQEQPVVFVVLERRSKQPTSPTIYQAQKRRQSNFVKEPPAAVCFYCMHLLYVCMCLQQTKDPQSSELKAGGQLSDCGCDQPSLNR